MAVDLVFGGARYTSQPIGLVFGDDGGVISIPPVYAEAYMVVPLPVLSAAVQYNNRVQRYMGTTAQAPYEVGAPSALSKDVLFAVGEMKARGETPPWGRGRGVDRSATLLSARPLSRIREHAPVWRVADLAGDLHREDFEVALKVGSLYRSAQSIALGVGRSVLSVAEVATLLPGVSSRVMYQVARQAGLSRLARAGAGRPAQAGISAGRVPWNTSIYPPPGKTIAPGQPEEPPPHVGDTELLFQCPIYLPGAPVVLIFGGSCDIVVPPITVDKVYVIMNSMTLRRVSDSVEVECLSANVRTDKSSWGWQFTLSIPSYELEKVEPTVSGVVELELELNGVLWRFAAESYNTRETFGRKEVTVEGRSLTAYLDAPYSSKRSWSQPTAGSLTAVQLAQGELDRPGVPTGFTLDWNLSGALGWVVPGGVWTYSDLSPIQAIKAVAEGVLGYVNSDPLLKTLKVRSSYPSLPWQWAGTAADLTLPKSLMKARGLTWLEKPLYNGVYVSGENVGVLGFIKRVGSDGSALAPMHVHPLITEDAAALEAGRAILSSSGKQALVMVDVPMHSSIGLVNPGTLLEVTGDTTPWKGLSRSVSIQATRGRGLVITQSLEVERHYY